MYTADIWLCMRYYSQVVVRWAESTLIGGRSHHPNLSPAANPTIRGAPVKPPSSPPTSLLFRLVSSRVLQDYRAYTCTTHWRNIIKRWASAFTTESDNLRFFFFFTMEIDWYAPATVALSLHSEVMDEKKADEYSASSWNSGRSVSPLLCFFLCGRNISIPPKTTRAELKSPGQREKWKGEKNIRQLRIYGPYQCIGLSCIDKTVSPLSVYRQEEEVKKKCRGENVGRPWAGVDFEPSPPYGFLFFSLNQREP